MYHNTTRLSKNDRKYNEIVEDTRKSRCESALENIKNRLIEINDTFVEKLYENTFFPNNARIIMQVYNSFSRINEFFDRNNQFSYYYDCKEREKLVLLKYFCMFFFESAYHRRYYEYKQNIITPDMNPLVVESCDKLFSIITTKIDSILDPLRALRRRIKEEEYTPYNEPRYRRT